jgi:hypothetical protein
MVRKKLLAPCGIYCLVCGVYIAHRDDNLNFKEKLSKTLGLAAEKVACRGCRSELTLELCRTCPVRNCATQKGFEGCAQCPAFPCPAVERLPRAIREVALRAIPAWREQGAEEYMRQEYRRHLCPQCGYPLFMGARRCRICREPVDLR